MYQKMAKFLSSVIKFCFVIWVPNVFLGSGIIRNDVSQVISFSLHSRLWLFSIYLRLSADRAEREFFIVYVDTSSIGCL